MCRLFLILFLYLHFQDIQDSQTSGMTYNNNKYIEIFPALYSYSSPCRKVHIVTKERAFFLRLQCFSIEQYERRAWRREKRA